MESAINFRASSWESVFVRMDVVRGGISSRGLGEVIGSREESTDVMVARLDE